jgi:putative addiction module component (TIGR02574 family)
MPIVTIADLQQLSLPERLRLVEELWDTIASDAEAHPERLPLDAGLRRELRRRAEAYRLNPDDVIPVDDALDEIERSLG